MQRYYDLHIHSCLSPCASDDMTPANIAGMAHIKGLSLIALTDHNAGHNLPAMAQAASEYGLIFIPGIEVNTSEEVHVLTYFADVDAAVTFGETLYDALPGIQNRPDIFGNQLMMDEAENSKGTLDKLLLQAVPFSIDDIVKMAKAAGGCAVPAHINRDSFSLFANLGFLPPGLFRCVEVAKGLPCPELNSGLMVLHSSDAHDLGAISEPIEVLNDINSGKDFVQFVNGY
jgi:hypothetical protein